MATGLIWWSDLQAMLQAGTSGWQKRWLRFGGKKCVKWVSLSKIKISQKAKEKRRKDKRQYEWHISKYKINQKAMSKQNL